MLVCLILQDNSTILSFIHLVNLLNTHWVLQSGNTKGKKADKNKIFILGYG